MTNYDKVFAIYACLMTATVALVAYNGYELIIALNASPPVGEPITWELAGEALSLTLGEKLALVVAAMMFAAPVFCEIFLPSKMTRNQPS